MAVPLSHKLTFAPLLSIRRRLRNAHHQYLVVVTIRGQTLGTHKGKSLSGLFVPATVQIKCISEAAAWLANSKVYMETSLHCSF